MAEVDFSWVNVSEPWERLAWARAQRGFETATAFADSIGMRPNTYHNFEREPGRSKNTVLTAEKAKRFARPLRVRWEWLVDGTGNPWAEEPSLSPVAERLAGRVNALPEAEQRRVEAVVDALLRTGT